MENNIYSLAAGHGLNERKAVDVSSGICPCGPSKKVRAAIRKAIRDIRFSPDPSLMRLRRTISSKLGIDGDCLIFANSVEELLSLISGVFRPVKVLAIGPSLDTHLKALATSGAIVESPGGETAGFFKEGKEIAPVLQNSGLVFISQPNRITGLSTDKVDSDRILEFCETGNRLAVVDESLIEFTDAPGSCERAACGQGVIVLHSIANFYGMPGLGLAYAVSSSEIIGRLAGRNHCEVNTLAASAARAAVRDKTYRKTARKYISEERKFLVESLEKIGGFTCYESDSNVFLVKSDHSAEEISGRLARHGFLIRVWRPEGTAGESFLRISVMEHEKNVKFLRILKQTVCIGRTAGGSVSD